MRNIRLNRFGHLGLWVAAISIAILLPIAGCGGDDDDDSTNSNTTTPSTRASATSQASHTTQATEAPTQTTTTAGDDQTDVLSDLRDLSKELANATGKVTYRFDSTTSEGAFVGTTTIHFKEGNSRTDFSSEEGTYTIISTASASYFCTASGGQGFCSQGQGGLNGSSQLPFVQSFSDDEQFQSLVDSVSDVRSAGDRTIAGVDTNCYAFSGDFGGGPGTGTMCVSDIGLVLLAHFDADSGDVFDMEASAVSDAVADSDFEPPYPVSG